MSEPPNVMLVLPWAAVAGVVVRSPVRVLIGRCLILPFTDSTRCTLLTFLVLWTDFLNRGAASGSAAPDPFEDDEQPLTIAAAIESAAKTARIGRRVCITCRVAGRSKSTVKSKVAAASRWGATITSLRRCSPE